MGSCTRIQGTGLGTCLPKSPITCPCLGQTHTQLSAAGTTGQETLQPRATGSSPPQPGSQAGSCSVMGSPWPQSVLSHICLSSEGNLLAHPVTQLNTGHGCCHFLLPSHKALTGTWPSVTIPRHSSKSKEQSNSTSSPIRQGL